MRLTRTRPNDGGEPNKRTQNGAESYNRLRHKTKEMLMPTRKTTQKKNGRSGESQLETAIAVLINNQATFIQNLTEVERANAERFGRIEQLLLRHELMLQELPEAIRQKIGFQK